MHKILMAFINAPRSVKRILSVAYDCLAITASFYLAYVLRMGTFNIEFNLPLIACLGITMFISIFTFVRMGLYRAILRYMTYQAMITVFIGIAVSSVVMAASGFFLHAFIPRSVPIIYLFTTIIFVGLPRLIFRNIVHLFIPKGDIKVIIYGAGQSGHSLAIQLQQTSKFLPVAFIDDNPKLQGNNIRGINVYHSEKCRELIKKYEANRILLALGNDVTKSERLKIIHNLEPLKIEVQTIPLMSDILRGDVQLKDIRSIQIEDLLGRDPIAPNRELLQTNITGKIVMVTGAGGSIGSELCRQIIRLAPKTLILFEQNEFNLYNIENETNALADKLQIPINIVPLLGSVQHKQHLEVAMRSYGVETVYHAAAYKHVPLVEHNIVEGVKNNLLGTKCAVEAAIAASVKNFVLISTDKAVRPTNIMGATKRFAEMLLQHHARKQKGTLLSMVRFGNVLGSSGSVVPKFKEQIKRGGPITVTHKDITRYFMTISEAAQLVIQAGAMAEGGDVFVLDMGEPVKIVDLAKEMAFLSGLTIKNEDNPNGEIEIKFTGLRPGEKLYEELLISDNCSGTRHPRILKARETCLSENEIENFISKAEECCKNYNQEELYKALKQTLFEYTPAKENVDMIYNAKLNHPKLKLISSQENKNH